MQPFSTFDSSIASQTVTTSIGSSTWPQYAESSCHGTRLPVPAGLAMKWLDQSAMSGPIKDSTTSSTLSSNSHSNSFVSSKCGTSKCSGDWPVRSTNSTTLVSKCDFSESNFCCGKTG